jgi:hypothetical protein
MANEQPDACRLCAMTFKGRIRSFDPEICKDCAETLKIKKLPPPRRPARPCERCNGLTFVRSLPREYSGEYDNPYPMTAAQSPTITNRFFGLGNSVNRADPRGHGVLEIYTCVGCGFVEWYCQDPDQIPIGPEHLSDLVDYSPESPYR